MNDTDKSTEIKKEFNKEFAKTLKQLKNIYPRVSRVKKNKNLSEEDFTITIYSILLNILRQVQIDSTLLTFNEFHAKYVPNLPILYRDDFSCQEFKEIIDSTYMKERDKQIAHKYFVDKKNTQEVFDELLEIGNKKTVDNNLDAINDALLLKACKYNKLKHSK